MSDPKPDRILAEESDNPWVKLILWSNEDPLRPANRWNGFMKYLAEESLSTLEPLNLTDEQRLGFMKDWGTDSAEFKRTLPLSGDELEHAKTFFRMKLILEISYVRRSKTIVSVTGYISEEHFLRDRSVLRIVVLSAPLIFMAQVSILRLYFRIPHFPKKLISQTLSSALPLSSIGSRFVERLIFIGSRLTIILQRFLEKQYLKQ